MNPIARRTLLATGLGLGAVGTLTSSAAAQAEEVDSVMVTERQSGDPDSPAEGITFDAIKVQSIASGHKAKFEPRIVDFNTRLLAVAQRYVGKSRKNAHNEVAALLNLFELPFAWPNGTPVPFCAAGVSNMAALAYGEAKGLTVDRFTWNKQLQPLLGDVDHHHFYPSPSVMDMYYVAQGKHRWATAKVMPKPGWLVVYDWKKNGGADHVGIVESATATGLKTIEFNTSVTTGNQRDGGQIARKTRARDATVKGFINTSLKTLV